MEFKKHPERIFLQLLSAPFIYGMIIPTLFLDICLEIYHRICFPLYGLPYIKRRAYIKIDRQKLSYLNPIEKVHCMYCGYANGVYQYTAAVAAATEHYWCGIMHKKEKGFKQPAHHRKFLPYDDAEAFKEYLKK